MTMEIDPTIEEFSLFGGPLQRLGRRLGLVRGGNTFGLGVALGLLAWGVLMVLALLKGVGPRLFSLVFIGVHVRFLVAIPLFFLCETWVAPRMATFVRDIVRSGIVPESGCPALVTVIRSVRRMRDPWKVEILFLVAVGLFVFIEPFIDLPGRTANWKMLLTESGGSLGPVLGWYLWFCLPLFRFLMLRWVWHLGLWCYFLWRVQRLDLRLIPSHPDQAAGLGYLEIVQEHFGMLVVAISMVFTASFAEDIASGAMAFEALYRLVPMVVVVVALLFIGPLFVFSSKLWACRVTGWSDYMGMASRYVNHFDRKWIRGENPSGEALLGTPDLQSLADLTNSVNVVRGMRWVPASRGLVLSLGLCTIVPMVPLVFFKYPVSDVAARIFQTLTGL
jgi:hypothetical protein